MSDTQQEASQEAPAVKRLPQYDPTTGGYWQAKLRGEEAEASEGTPHCGFYRLPTKDRATGRRSWEPVAYYMTPDGMVCVRGSNMLSTAKGLELWISVCRYPVPEEVYRAVEEGQPWPDDYTGMPTIPPEDAWWRDDADTPPPMGDNNPPLSAAEKIIKEIEDNWHRAKIRLEKREPITDPVECDRIVNLRDRLLELRKLADAERVKEKRPIDDLAKAVQAKWVPIIETAEKARDRLGQELVTPFLEAEQDRMSKEALEAKALAEITGAETATEATGGRGRTEAEAWVPARASAGTRGRVTSLRHYKVARILDYDVVLAHYARHTEVAKLIQEMCNKDVRVGAHVPGIEIIKIAKAV